MMEDDDKMLIRRLRELGFDLQRSIAKFREIILEIVVRDERASSRSRSIDERNRRQKSAAI